MQQQSPATNPAINLVSTRCTDSNHLALQRWYADHVQLLLASPHLQQAQLFRCAQPLAGQTPDYFCVYEFASHDDFLSFEHSHQKAQAGLLTNAAAGRSSIDIVQRTQYTRWLHRQWPASSLQQSQPWRLAVCIQSDSEWTLDAQRWLADHCQALRGCTPLLCAQLFVQHAHPAQAFLALDFFASQPQEVWQLVEQFFKQPSLYGAMPTVQIQWAASASLVQAWLR